jgi:2-methylcitrate dehydratase PrpD
MILTDYVHSFDKGNESIIWGTPFRAAANNAALVNGTTVHSFELDDFHMLGAHPAGIVIPAALAIAEHKGGVNGKDFLTAIAIGFELTLRLTDCCGASGRSAFERGIHGPSACGFIGSAAAAAKLLELDEEGVLNAFGISIPPLSLQSAQYGAMVKRLFAGKAAQTGVMGAQLSGRGFTGIKDILELKFGSFCKAISDGYDLTRLTVGLGQEYLTKEDGFKKYSCVATNFAALDAVREIMNEHSVNIEKIKRVTLTISDFTKTHAAWEYKPEGVMNAQMNIYYCIAIMLLEGDCFVDQFSEEKLANEKVRELTKLIDIIVDPEMDKQQYTKWGARVEIEFKTGERLSRKVDFYRGSARNPMSYEEIKNKFVRLAQKKISIAKANSIIATVEELEELKDIGELAGLLVP